MENYFYINDIDSRTINVFCGSFPDIVIPQLRQSTIEIEGRHGSLTETDNCYKTYVFSLECYSPDLQIEAIEQFFRNTRTLRFSNNSEKVYSVKIKNQIDLSLVAEYWRNFTIVFEVQPIIKSFTEYEEIITTTPQNFVVGGTYDTKPIIELFGTGNFTLTINNKNIIINNLESEKITIDTDLKLAFINNQNAMSKINGDLNDIKLNVGNNIVSTIGVYDSFKIKYKRCFLC